MTPDHASNLDWLDGLQNSGIRPGLRRMRALLRALRNPEAGVPAIIVAGTNGKGSTSATLASILRHSGYRTALYTSPHLVDLRERWSIDGQPIDAEALDRAIRQLQVVAKTTSILPTYFEALTLLAFIAFAEARCDVSVLEVGMGGRLDATNVVRPLAALITPIGLDHTEYLGNTIRQIAREKAGVIHRGAIVLTSNEDPAIVEVLRRRAAQFAAPFHLVDESHPTPLRGPFQSRNAALAVRAAEELRGRFPAITTDSIERGVAATRWRGRLERFKREGHEIWVDGCHNAHAAEAIAPFIDASLPRPRLLVFGIMGDKDFARVVEILFPRFDSIITTEPYPPRSVPSDQLASLARERGIPVVSVQDPASAMRLAMKSAIETIFIGGSLYLAGSAIAFLES